MEATVLGVLCGLALVVVGAEIGRMILEDWRTEGGSLWLLLPTLHVVGGGLLLIWIALH